MLEQVEALGARNAHSLALSYLPRAVVTLGQGTWQTGLPTTLTTPSQALGPSPPKPKAYVTPTTQGPGR